MSVKPFRSVEAARPINTWLTNQEYQRSAHDMYCEMFLDGYEECTALTVSSGTGLAVVLFVCFINTFDQEFEQGFKLGNTSPYMDILKVPVVAEIWGALAEYLDATGRADILTHLLDTFGTHYDQYCQHLAAARSDGGFGAVFRLAEYDSGKTLLAIYDIIRLFNGHRHYAECADEFYAVGMAGKFFDDLRDLADDVAAGSPNLLHALTAEHPHEESVLAAALLEHTHFTLSWWSLHCPTSLSSYFHHSFRYYDQVRSPKLRLPLDVLLALLGIRLYWRRPIHRSPARLQCKHRSATDGTGYIFRVSAG